MTGSGTRAAPRHRGDAGDSHLRVARRVAAETFGPPEERPFSIRYWDGSFERAASAGASRFTLVIRRPGALRAMLLPPSQLALGEAFLRGDIDLEGDLEAAAPIARAVAHRLADPRRIVRLTGLLLRLPSSGSTSAAHARRRPRLWGRRHSQHRDAAAIRHHYDVGNEFYQLWLDSQTVYSCGYFPPGVEDVDAAQAAKLDYICRKLRLRPGERLLDIGCGWGALVRHAVRRYGVEAVGITLSPAQAELATRRTAKDGLGDRCRVEVRDYRDLPNRPAFDKIASVGMFEHVGRARLPGYFATAFRVLRPGGLFLNHGIIDLEAAQHQSVGTRLRQWFWREGRFLQRYVFPDGQLVPLAEVVRAAEHVGFESRDVESLREHYVLTLRHWVQRLEAREREAVALVGEATFRVWRLYLAASAQAFATGRIGVVQLLLSKPRVGAAGAMPLTRHDLYLDPQPERVEAWTR
jgi:cyclopropane-fatty-acyl-phospholipid synthase